MGLEIFQISAEEAQQCRQTLDRLAAIDWQPTLEKIQQAQRAWSNLSGAIEGYRQQVGHELDRLAKVDWRPTLDMLRSASDALNSPLYLNLDFGGLKALNRPPMKHKGGRPKGRTSDTDIMTVEVARRIIAGETNPTRAAMATLKHRGVKGNLKNKADYLVKIIKKRF
jgi:hypothetical protein